MNIKLKYIITTFILPISIFAANPIVSEANSAYRQGKFEDAYSGYANYLCNFALNSDQDDYYIALIGKNNCMKHLDSAKMFKIERSYISKHIEPNITEEQQELLCGLLETSAYLK